MREGRETLPSNFWLMGSWLGNAKDLYIETKPLNKYEQVNEM